MIARRKLLGRIAAALVAGWIVVSIFVEIPAGYRLEHLGGSGPESVLVLYHPSRDARFSDDISLALAEEFKAAGLRVDRATMSSGTPAQPKGYSLIAVVSNTYYWNPDLPTMQYLGRSRFAGIPVIGIIGGAGTTGRSQRVLEAALRDTRGELLGVRSLWLWRPNDLAPRGVSNRQLAKQLAAEFARTAVQKIWPPKGL